MHFCKMFMQFCATFDDMFREDILFSVNPQMFISFLRTVKNFREIPTFRAILIKHLLVKHLVRMRELVTILTILYLNV